MSDHDDMKPVAPLRAGRGTTECPICGLATPHYHDPEEIARSRQVLSSEDVKAVADLVRDKFTLSTQTHSPLVLSWEVANGLVLTLDAVATQMAMQERTPEPATQRGAFGG